MNVIMQFHLVFLDKSLLVLKRRLMYSLCLVASIFGLTLAARADNGYYGRVEGFEGDRIVIHTTAHSTGHWKLDGNTTRENGGVEVNDWVHVSVSESGHVEVLRFEERPVQRAGVIRKLHGNVLTIHSGSDVDTWNVMDTTRLNGLVVSDLQPGDEIGFKTYKNHNLATIWMIKAGTGSR